MCRYWHGFCRYAWMLPEHKCFLWRKIFTFQNFKNYWNPLKTRKVTCNWSFAEFWPDLRLKIEASKNFLVHCLVDSAKLSPEFHRHAFFMSFFLLEKYLVEAFEKITIDCMLPVRCWKKINTTSCLIFSLEEDERPDSDSVRSGFESACSAELLELSEIVDELPQPVFRIFWQIDSESSGISGFSWSWSNIWLILRGVISTRLLAWIFSAKNCQQKQSVSSESDWSLPERVIA